MSYQVLARKWRPHTFLEMVGQEHVLRMLTNALDQQRLHHAYLFTGTRGVGKTTLARILAKCLNCEGGISSTPCGTCGTCQSVDAGRFLDLIEIDAASRTKVEDTRELLDNVQYAPTQGRYKIYLIDEVHMLSSHSFNALLKTLEEPPAHVKFLLATTDPKRLPVTILSRCLQFNLKRVPVEQITQQLQHICTAENISFDVEGLEQVAEAADGSMRDALSLLDQAIAFCGNHIQTDEVRRMLGNVEQDQIFRLLGTLAQQDGSALLRAIAELAEQAPDFDGVLEQMTSSLHAIATLQAVPNLPEQPAAVTDLAGRLSPEEVQLYYQIALIGRRDLPLASSPRRGFEMIMLRMLAFKPVSGTETVATPTKKAITEPARSAPVPASAAMPEKKPVAMSTPKAPSATDNWADILTQLSLTGMTQALASHCVLGQLTDNMIELILSAKHQPLLNAKLQERLSEAINRHFNKTLQLQITISKAELNTYAKQQEETQKTRHANAVDAITSDNHVQKIMDVFGATLDLDSIKAVDPS